MHDPFDLFAAMKAASTRWGDLGARGEMLELHFLIDPACPFVHEILAEAIKEQRHAVASVERPEWHLDDPARGTMPQLASGRIPICTLQTGDTLSVPVKSMTRNVLVVGPTGGGKSNLLRIFLAALLELYR